jgi:hypothetical protein
MPAIGTVTLNGYAGADHVFAPNNITGPVATWFAPGTSPVGDEKLTVSLVRLPSGNLKYVMKMVLPKTQDVTVGSVTTSQVVKTGYATLEITMSQSHTQTERQEILELLRSALSSTEWVNNSDCIVYARPFY